MKTLFELLLILLILLAIIALLLFIIFKYIQRKIKRFFKLRKPAKKKNESEKKPSEEDIFIKAIPNEIDVDEPYWDRATDTIKVKNMENTISKQKNRSYHINKEGKIYPCKTRTLQCLYDKETHSNNKVALYYTLIKTYGVRVKPHKEVLEEILKYIGLKNLYSLSNTLEEEDYPIDLIVATLGNAIVTIDEKTIKNQYYIHSKRSYFESSAANSIAILIHRGGYKRFQTIKERIPNRILKMGIEELDRQEEMDRHFERGRYSKRYISKKELERIEKEREKTQRYHEDKIRSMFAEFAEYEKDENWRLYDDNTTYHKHYGWLIRAFEQFSHDLNISNIINQPIFYKSIEEAKNTIKTLENNELFSAFDDCSITVEEIEKFVGEANYFNYTRRRDLTKKANDNLSRWYAMNRETYIKFRQINSSHRDNLAKEVAEELVRRDLLQIGVPVR